MTLDPNTMTHALIWAGAIWACVHRVCLAIEKIAPASKAAQVAATVDSVAEAVKNAAGLS